MARKYVSTDPDFGEPIEPKKKRRYVSTDPNFGATDKDEKEPEGSAVGRFVGGAWQNLNPVTMVKGVAQMVAHPVDTAQSMVDASADQFGKAQTAVDKQQEIMRERVRQARAEGAGPLGVLRAAASGYVDALPETLEGGGHAVAATVPLVGPAAAHAGERIAEGDIAGGLGEGVGLLAAPKVTSAAVKGAAGAARFAAAPLASKVNPAVAAAAERTGVEMPASALSESKLVPLAETVSAKGLGGSKTAARYDAATRTLTEKAEHVQKRASKLADDPMAQGEAIAKGAENYKAHWAREKNRLYKEAELPTKMNLFVQAKDTVKFLDDVIAEKDAAVRVLGKGGMHGEGFGAPMLRELRGLRDRLTVVKKVGGREVRVPRDIQARDLAAARKILKDKADWNSPVATGDKAVIKRLSATLEGELDAVISRADPQLAAKIAAAKTHYAEGLGKINSTLGKNVFRLAKEGKYEQVAKAVNRPSVGADDIPRIMEVVGAEGSDAMRAAALAHIIKKAKRGGEQLTPKGLQTAIDTFGDGKLRALATPEQYARLKDVSGLMAAMEKGTRVMGGSQTLPLARATGYPAAIGAAVMGEPMALAYIIGDQAFNRIVGTRAGQRWLTSGFAPISRKAGESAARGAGVASRPGASVAQMPPAKPRPAYPRAADEEDDDEAERRQRLATR